MKENIAKTEKLLTFLRANNETWLIKQIQADLYLYKMGLATWENTCIKNLIVKITK